MATYIPQQNEDAASADGDLGVPILAVRKATPANTSGSDGDYEFLQMSAGRVWVSATIDAALPAGTNAIGKLAANDGVDIGDVTVNNAAGAAAVNIQDGGNVITVDGTVGVSGTVTVAGTVSISGSVAVTGPLTDAELRASAVPISAAALPLPSGAATAAGQASLLTELQLKADLTETQPVSAASLPLPSGASTAARQDTLLTELQLKADLTETQPVSIAGTVAISAAALPLPSGAATSAKQDSLLTELQLKADLTETQPVSLASVPSHAVTNAGVFAVQDSEKVVDNAGFTDGTTKVLPAGFIFDETAGTALTENDAAAARVNSNRAQVMVIEDASSRSNKAGVTLGGGLKVDILSIAGTAPTTAGLLNVHGNVAHDVADSGNPVKIGGKARQTNPTAVTDADRVDLYMDDLGRPVVVPNAPRDLVSDGTATRTSSTAFADLIAADASNMNDLLWIVFANTSATGTEVQVANADDTTIRLVFYVPANDTRGIVFHTPHKGSAANAAWRWKTVTSVASVKASFQYMKNGA